MSALPDISKDTHSHQFNEGNPLAERNTLRAVAITAVMMVVEIVGGYLLNSMALPRNSFVPLFVFVDTTPAVAPNSAS